MVFFGISILEFKDGVPKIKNTEKGDLEKPKQPCAFHSHMSSNKTMNGKINAHF
jgi:hypothetical protein